MSTRTCVRVLVPALMLATGLLHAAEHPIQVTDPVAFATPPGAPTAAVFLALHNRAATADRLVGASTPAAGRIEIHTMHMTDGVMRMRPVDGVDIPAGGSAVLQRGGQHLMLLELPGPLVAGTRLELTLRFQHAPPLQLGVPVLPRLGTPPATPAARASHMDPHP